MTFQKNQINIIKLKIKIFFFNLEPKIDINYLFKMINEPYYI